MYVVRFVRKDSLPTEEYFYHNLEDARFHMNLFAEDDSGLYLYVEIDKYS